MSKPDLQKVPAHLHEEINLVEQVDLKEAFPNMLMQFLF